MKLIIPDKVASIESTIVEKENAMDYRRLCACGRMFTAYRSFQRYCSDKCRAKYTKGKYSTYKKKPIKEVTCKECGKTFTTNDSKRHYCSKECFEIFQKNRHVPSEKRKCFVCGKEFETTHWVKRYCSTECRMLARKESI